MDSVKLRPKPAGVKVPQPELRDHTPSQGLQRKIRSAGPVIVTVRSVLVSPESLENKV